MRFVVRYYGCFHGNFESGIGGSYLYKFQQQNIKGRGEREEKRGEERGKERRGRDRETRERERLNRKGSIHVKFQQPPSLQSLTLNNYLITIEKKKDRKFKCTNRSRSEVWNVCFLLSRLFSFY